MSLPDLSAFFLTLKLAASATFILLLIGVPIAWWLANTTSRIKPALEALIAMPLVLPPTVLGFYLLVLMNPDSVVGAFWVRMTGDTLTFSFAGLVIASVVYSLPFMVQPLQSAFEGTGRAVMELAASLRASPLDAFFNVAAPASFRGFVTAIVLTFAHTIGEFGVVLMVGGNIPGRTRVISVEIYEHVESLEYAQAHALSLILLVLSFSVLLFVYVFNRRYRLHVD